MQNLLEIDGITREACSLLEAAGYTDLDALRSNSPELIHAELSKANKMLTIIDQDPSLEMVRSWCDCSIEDGEDLSQVVTATKDEAIVAVKDSVRVEKKTALALSEAFIENQKIELADLPRVTVVAEKSDEHSEPLTDTILPKSLPKKTEARALKRVASKKFEVDKSKLKSLDDYRNDSTALAPHEKRQDANNVREATAGINLGVDPSSEEFIRGVLHNDAQRTHLGAFGLLLSFVLLLSSIGPIIYILFQREYYIWGWMTPVILFFALMCYLLMARKSSCPVCRQRQFVPKACRKHVKAHTWPLLGNMLPTAWHLLRFKWFRCIFCGTSIRVKE
jgi:hypothetical protein